MHEVTTASTSVVTEMTFEGHSGSSETLRFDIAYDFLLAFHSNCGPILYRFPHIARYWSKIAKFI